MMSEIDIQSLWQKEHTDDIKSIPDGEYVCRCDSVKIKTLDDGRQLIDVSYVITEGPFVNWRLNEALWFQTDGGMGMTKRTFKTFNEQLTDWSKYDFWAAFAEFQRTFPGKNCIVKLKTKTDKSGAIRQNASLESLMPVVSGMPF